MLPRWHIFWGALFVLLIWYFAPDIDWVYLLLIFLASILIDIDHYIISVIKTGRLTPFHLFKYHKMKVQELKKEKRKGIRRKADFHFFHTIDFLILIAITGFFWAPFFFIFIGMIFHSLLDLVSALHNGYFYSREYFFFNWIRKKLF